MSDSLGFSAPSETITPRQVLSRCKLMPVVAIESAADAVPLAEALLAGGVNVIEITLRTPAALSAIEHIARHVPDMWVGAGTIVRPQQLADVASAGSRFALSPGLTQAVLDAARAQQIPFIPGIATASDIMLGMAAGLDTFKFFPADSSGGVATLQAFAGPFPGVLFCPTGGIRQETAASYLAVQNVACVGGSWLTPGQLLREKAWKSIAEIASHSLSDL
jgi:2-dehydro-3-deoxyphosphogluconate aldolase/(4S)-4-hydroxy-2-oxoglutarate aldolase